MVDVREDLLASTCKPNPVKGQLTLSLKFMISSSVNVSALAMTGMRLTLVCNRRITSISRGLSE